MLTATFRKATVEVEDLKTGDDQREMDIVELSYPDGKVVAFPADHRSPETGLRYRDMWRGKYEAFKRGEADPDRVAQLEREIEERQAELNSMRGPDDERVQENLGYGGKGKGRAARNQPTRIAPSTVQSSPGISRSGVTGQAAKDAGAAKPVDTSGKKPAA